MRRRRNVNYKNELKATWMSRIARARIDVVDSGTAYHATGYVWVVLSNLRTWLAYETHTYRYKRLQPQDPLARQSALEATMKRLARMLRTIHKVADDKPLPRGATAMRAWEGIHAPVVVEAPSGDAIPNG